MHSHLRHLHRTKMIKTFSLSALFFLSLGILVASYATLPV
jgi:hypothetical protein